MVLVAIFPASREELIKLYTVVESARKVLPHHDAATGTVSINGDQIRALWVALNDLGRKEGSV